jgi:hypothetical protein
MSRVTASTRKLWTSLSAACARARDEPLEAALARAVEHDPREGGIVLDDEQHPIARRIALAIVLDRRLMSSPSALGGRLALVEQTTRGGQRASPCAVRTRRGRLVARGAEW